MAFCLYCRKETPHVRVSTPRTFFVKGTEIEYEELSAHCPTCKCEIYIPELHDQNCLNREKACKRTMEEWYVDFQMRNRYE